MQTTHTEVADEDVLDLSGEATKEIPKDMLPSLLILELTNNRITKIESLERLTRLEKLVLRQNLIPKVENLSTLTKLKDIDLYDNKISVFENLALPSLTNLDISFNMIRVIPQIKHTDLPVIQQLYFVQNKIKKIQGLEELTTLTLLELGSNRIREIEGLSTLVNLTTLWLGSNKITAIKDIGTLTRLEKLSIQSNRLTTIGSGLQHLVNLKELYLSANGITEIDGLDTLVNLQILDLAGNKIVHLSNMNKLVNLEEFWCNNNLLESYEELERELTPLTKLRTLYLEHNPLSNIPQYKQRIIHMFTSLVELDSYQIRGPK